MRTYIKLLITFFTFDKLFKIALLIVLMQISSTLNNIYLHSPADLSGDLSSINAALENINQTLDGLKDTIELGR